MKPFIKLIKKDPGFFIGILIFFLLILTSFTDVAIRQYLLFKIPVGTNIKSLVTLCEKKKYECNQYAYADNGYWDETKNETVGVKAIETTLADFLSSPLTRTMVSVKWGFDKEDKLVDILVNISTDGP